MNNNNSSKQILLSVLGVAILVVAVVGIGLVICRLLLVHVLYSADDLLVFLLGVGAVNGVVLRKLRLYFLLYLIGARAHQDIVPGHTAFRQLFVKIRLSLFKYRVLADDLAGSALAGVDVVLAALDIAIDELVVAFLNGGLVLLAKCHAQFLRLIEDYLLVNKLVDNGAALRRALLRDLGSGVIGYLLLEQPELVLLVEVVNAYREVLFVAYGAGHPRRVGRRTD